MTLSAEAAQELADEILFPSANEIDARNSAPRSDARVKPDPFCMDGPMCTTSTPASRARSNAVGIDPIIVSDENQRFFGRRRHRSAILKDRAKDRNR